MLVVEMEGSYRSENQLTIWSGAWDRTIHSSWYRSGDACSLEEFFYSIHTFTRLGGDVK